MNEEEWERGIDENLVNDGIPQTRIYAVRYQLTCGRTRMIPGAIFRVVCSSVEVSFPNMMTGTTAA